MTYKRAVAFAVAVPVSVVVASAVTGQILPSSEAPGVSPSSVADAQAIASAGSAGPAETSPPIITLDSLGFEQGITFSQLDGRADLTFRVPVGAWLSGARLILPYRSWIGRETPRNLTVLSGAEVLAEIPVTGDGRVDIPIPAEALETGELQISLVYVGGLIPHRCADDRLAGDRLLFDPKGGLELQPTAGSEVPIAAVMAMLGTEPAIRLPANPTERQAAAALTIVAARGRAVLSPQASRTNGVVQIGGESDPALRTLGPSTLAVGGNDPAGVARAVFSGAAVFPDTARVDRLNLDPALSPELYLSDLGASTATINVNKTHSWTATLPASRIPDGRSIRGLSVDVASVGAGPTDRLSAWLNGNLLGSSPIKKSGITQLKVRARDNLTNAINSVTVRVDRPALGDCGEAHLAMPAQLLETSSVVLGPVEGMEDFHDFASASSKGVTVVVSSPAMLPLAGRAVAALIGSSVPITVSYGKMPADGPAIVVANSPPAGTTPPLSLANGRLQLASSKSGTNFDMPQSPSDTVVQLVRDDGRPVLWVRPARSGAVPANMWLNQGDIAIVNPAGMIQALSTTRERLDAPVEIEPQSWWERNDSKVFLSIGLLIAIALVAWSLRPSIKRTRPGQPK